MTAARQMQQENNLYYVHTRLARNRREHSVADRLRLGLFTFLMAAFVAVALMQMFELRVLLSEVEAVKGDIYSISQTRARLTAQYASNPEESTGSRAAAKP